MKKILALVLALVMVLCATTVLAEGSKKGSDLNGGTINNNNTSQPVGIQKVSGNAATNRIKQEVKDAQDGGNVMNAFPAGLVPDGYTTVNEMDTYQLTGDVAGLPSLTLNFKFATPFAEGEQVPIMIGIDNNGATEWIKLIGVGEKDGSVNVTLDQATLAKLSNNPFVVVPLSK